MITVINKFKINNTFAEWEKSFYSNQAKARNAGIYEIYHGHAQDDDKKVVVILNCLSEEHVQKFMEDNAEAISASGHILETTVSERYIN